MVKNPVFDLRIKHFPSWLWGQAVLWYLEFFSINEENATLLAQEGVIVQITYCFILKYIKKLKMYFNCYISVKSRGRKVDVSVE